MIRLQNNMITIDKAFYSNDKTILNVIIRTDSPSSEPLSAIARLYITKEGSDIGQYYDYNKTLALSGVSDILSIDILKDLTKNASITPDFYTTGITTVNIEYLSTTGSFSTYDNTEFYSHKLNMISVNCDISNIQKMSKKLTTYAFVEQMFISALDQGYIEDAKLFYSELVKLSSFGYSDVMQNNPNCEY